MVHKYQCQLCGEILNKHYPAKTAHLTRKQIITFRKYNLCPKCYQTVIRRAYPDLTRKYEEQLIELFKMEFENLKQKVLK